MHPTFKRLILILCACTLLPLPAGACVGKTLLIGSSGTPQQEILAHMLAILVGERTGTTAKVVRFPSAAAVHEALGKAELDLQVAYTGQGLVEVLKQPPQADRDAVYRSVKESYNQELNLVWLAPFGFEEPRVVPAGLPAQAAPVARKDTLKKFPALSRLIDKLGGLIDAAAMRKLEAEAQGRPAPEVARAFLKAQRLI